MTLLVEQFKLRRRHGHQQTLRHGVGTAAALAVRDGVLPRDVDVSKVQSRLRAAGVTLG